MFVQHFLKIKRYQVIFDLRDFIINVDQNAQFPFLTYLKHAIFLHRNRQLSGQFYISERNKQFLHTEIGNFPDDLSLFTSYAAFTQG